MLLKSFHELLTTKYLLIFGIYVKILIFLYRYENYLFDILYSIFKNFDQVILFSTIVINRKK